MTGGQQPLEQRFPFEVRWAPTRGWLMVRDCFTGEWLEVPKDAVPPRWKAMAMFERIKSRAELDRIQRLTSAHYVEEED